jgi:uncharacterized protein Smg (DUF494 family)
MKIENDNSFIEFEFEECIELRSDIACRVEVFCENFSGRVNSVWFSRNDIDQFIQQMEEFDKTRKGIVELSNMSSKTISNPLEFSIFSTDNLGHLSVQATLQKFLYLSHSANTQKITVSFEIDPSLLRIIIADFKKMFRM